VGIHSFYSRGWITIFEVSSLGSSSVFLDLPVLLFPLVAEMLDYLSCISFPWGITIFEVSSLGSSSVFLDLPVLLFPLVAEMLDYLSCISFPWSGSLYLKFPAWAQVLCLLICLFFFSPLSLKCLII
jgi:hypothetical protein